MKRVTSTHCLGRWGVFHRVEISQGTGRRRKSSNAFLKWSQWRQSGWNQTQMRKWLFHLEWKSQDVSFVLAIRCVQGRFVGGGGQSEQFARSDGTTSAAECKLCAVGNGHPSVGALEGGNLRPSASRFWSGLFSRLQAANHLGPCVLHGRLWCCYFLNSLKKNTSIRASPFDPKGLTSPAHWELGFNLRTQ